MKFALMLKTLSLAVLGSLLIAASAGAAAQGVSPLRASIQDDFDSALDGSDIFWTAERKTKPQSKPGYTYTKSLMRTSLLDGSKTLVHRFDPNDFDTGFPTSIAAGGGYVYVNMSGDGHNGDTLDAISTVLRISRDGSSVQKVASGELKFSDEYSIIVKRGKASMNDCGTRVDAGHVTSDGSVVIREISSERESKGCGGKKNVDHVRIYLLRPDGSVRAIASESLRITLDSKINKDGSWSAQPGSNRPAISVERVLGDRALLSRRRGSYYVRDLNTGTETGPYKAGADADFFFGLGSLDSTGRVAVSSVAITGSRKKPKVRIAAGVFRGPGDTASFAQNRGTSFLAFCGDRLIASNKNGVRELDPMTFNLLRPIAPRNMDGYAMEVGALCTSEYLYLSKSRGTGAAYLAYPLG